MLIGIISDTHGLLRHEALEALSGSQLIIHAGDVGSQAVLDGLRKIAPTFAVRGNVDTKGPTAELPETRLVAAGEVLIWVLHEIASLDIDPAGARYAAVIFGHSHRPSIETRNGVLYLNPGSAGPRRFRLPVTIARLEASCGRLRPEIITLGV
jgi:putative phosphoesterase